MKTLLPVISWVFLFPAFSFGANINALVGQVTSKVTHKIGNFESHVSKEEGKIYRELYPYFMDGCAAGQKVHLNGSRGSALGHGALFIKGACIDKSYPFPQVKTDCPEGHDEVGVSANGQFMNINWVAFEGEDLFFNGSIPEGTVLDEEYVTNFVRDMYQTGVFDKVLAKNTKTKIPLSAETKEGVLELIARESLTLDYALTWGRQTVCQRVPMKKDQIEKVVKFLNETNRYYYTEGNEYNWDMFRNSCGHLAQNAFAAAGIMEFRKPDSKGFSATQNIVIPSNFFMDLALATSGDRFPSVGDIAKDPVKVKALMESGIIAEQAGAITRYHPVYGHQDQSLNKLFDAQESTTGILAFHPFTGMNRKIQRQFTEKRYINLEENLRSYIGLYEKALASAKQLKVSFRKKHGHSMEAIRSRYIEVVERELASAKEKLARVSGA